MFWGGLVDTCIRVKKNMTLFYVSVVFVGKCKRDSIVIKNNDILRFKVDFVEMVVVAKRADFVGRLQNPLFPILLIRFL